MRAVITFPFDATGVFHTKHEDPETGRVWEGIIKYHIGATLDQPDLTPDKRLSVCHKTKLPY